MSHRVFTPEQDKEVVKLYLAGYATRKIAELFNCEKSAVSNALKREGVSRRTNRDLTDGEEAQILNIYYAGFAPRRIARAYSRSEGLIKGALKRQQAKFRDDRFNFCEAEEREIVKIYLAGHPMGDIARAYGCLPKTIRKALDRQGIETREASQSRVIKRRRQEIAGLYKDGKTVNQLSTIYKTSTSEISKALKKTKTTARTHRQDFFNEHAFDSLDNEHTLYWMGFVYADSYLSNYELKFGLSVRDLEHLKKFVRFMNSSKEVKHNHRACFASFASRSMVNTLDSLGLVSRRGQFDKLRNKIPIGLEHHFIRGYIDGDGCISNREKVIILGQADILLWIKECLVKYAQASDKVMPYQRKGIMEIAWGGSFQFVRVVDYIYKDATIYLERKKAIADKTKRG